MPYMLDEIHQQPDVIKQLVNAERNNVTNLASEIKKRDIELVMFAARGTSDHAAIYGKYLFEIKNALPVALADCSIFTLYNATLKLHKALVIGISQSGQAPDVIEYLKRCRELGALTAAITNEPDSPLSQVADYTILCHAGQELSIAATKTYTSALAAINMLSSALIDDGEQVDKLLACSDQMAKVLSVEKYIADKAERYRYMQAASVISRGFNFCTALEIALKLAETNYIAMRGFSAADFLHGPIATIHEGDPCILIAAPGKTYEMMLDMAKKLRERKAETLIISSEDDILALAATQIKLDARVDEELSPLLYVIPGQIFAYYLALARGYDPDQPRGLSKVTLTR